MNIEQLKQMMEADAVIDETALATEAIKTPRLYTKYQNIFYDLSQQLLDTRQQMAQLKLHLYEYWLGKSPDEVYKKRPKQKTVVKTDLEIYIRADEDYLILEKRLTTLELLAKMVDDYLKQLSARNYAIKNAIDYKKFENGGY